MKSSSGAHYPALDHVRAVAAFMVFAWHFTHSTNGYPVPFDAVPVALLSPLDEGHTGVALFMTLSGYLFAKILAGQRIHFGLFLLNRALRLLPLLVLVLGVVGVQAVLAGARPADYGWMLLTGFVLPVWPHGGWSVAVELHFYMLLPLLLWLSATWRSALPLLVLAAVALRVVLWWETGEIQSLAYWTLVGRIDQFVLGMAAYHGRSVMAGRAGRAAALVIGFVVLAYLFDRAGGFYGMPSYPSPSPAWIFIPTVEGLVYGALIAWYDARMAGRPGGRVSAFVGRLGSWSYSIYLLHFFVVFQMAAFVHERIMDISDIRLALPWALAGFVLMMPAGYLSFRLVEAPFLRLRRRYVAEAPAVKGMTDAAPSIAAAGDAASETRRG